MIDEAVKQGWHSNVPIVPDARLREVNLGSLQGLTHTEIYAKFGVALSRKIGAKILSDEDLRELGSERVDDLLARLLSSIAEGARHPALQIGPGSIAISTHGGVLRRLLHFAGGIEEIGFSIPNAVFFPFRYRAETGELRFLGTTEFPS
jgi:broad specificity phosphatase PhoE